MKIKTNKKKKKKIKNSILLHNMTHSMMKTYLDHKPNDDQKK